MEAVGLACNLARGIVDRSARIQANNEDCKILSDVVGKTLSILEHLQNCDIEDLQLTSTVEEIQKVLEGLDNAVTICSTSTYWANLFRAPEQCQMLRNAATKLERAIARIPMATISTMAEMHDIIVSLREEARKAKLRPPVELQELQQIKREIKKAHDERRQDSEEARHLMVQMLEKMCFTPKERLRELEILEQQVLSLKKDEDSLERFELQQIIFAVRESLRELAPVPTRPSEQVCCPISLAAMKDPVLLVDSGVTYERSEIVKWMKIGNRRDPVTQKEMTSGLLVPNLAVKQINDCFGSAATPESEDEAQTEMTARLSPGIYEGYGSYKFGEEEECFKYQFIVMVLEPGGTISGYFAPENPETVWTLGGRPIIKGTWKPDSTKIQIEDLNFKSQFEIEFLSAPYGLVFRMTGESVSLIHSVAEDVAKVTFPSISPPFVCLHPMLIPGLLELEGEIRPEEGPAYNAKLVMTLGEDGSSVRGWMSTEGIDCAHVLDGGIDEEGQLIFYIYVPLSEDTPVESDTSPEDFLASYLFTGKMSSDDPENEGESERPMLTGTCERKQNIKRPETDTLEALPGIDFEIPGEMSFGLFRRPSKIIPVNYVDEVRLLRFPYEPERILRLGVIVFKATERSGKVRDRWTLVFLRQYGADVMDVGVETEEAENPGDYYFRTHVKVSAPGCGRWVQDACYLTVAPKADFSKQVGPSEHYCGVHYNPDKRCAWTLLRRGPRMTLIVSENNPPETRRYAGYFLARPDFEGEKRDDVSCHATVRNDDSRRADIEFEYASI